MQGVSHLDTEMGTLQNLLTNSAVLVNALKEVAQPAIKPTAAQTKPDGSAPGARTDVDWAQTTDGLRYPSALHLRSLCALSQRLTPNPQFLACKARLRGVENCEGGLTL